MTTQGRGLRALDRRKEGVGGVLQVVRAVTVGLVLPRVARRRARKLAHRHFTALPLVDRDAVLSLNVRSGSAGDENARAAREEWKKTAS